MDPSIRIFAFASAIGGKAVRRMKLFVYLLTKDRLIRDNSALTHPTQ